MPFNAFDHTADLGLHIEADDLPGLFREAGRALLSALVAEPEKVRPTESWAVELQADSHDYLLHDWLAELLYAFDAQRKLAAAFEVAIEPTDCDEIFLTATVYGEPVDLQRHQIEMELKAITYHGLKVERTATGWLAEVIVDL